MLHEKRCCFIYLSYHLVIGPPRCPTLTSQYNLLRFTGVQPDLIAFSYLFFSFLWFLPDLGFLVLFQPAWSPLFLARKTMAMNKSSSQTFWVTSCLFRLALLWILTFQEAFFIWLKRVQTKSEGSKVELDESETKLDKSITKSSQFVIVKDNNFFDLSWIDSFQQQYILLILIRCLW